VIFKETRLKGAYEIDLEPQSDERGFFARSYCWREFEAHGLNPRVVQCNVSYNRKRGTLRGVHYQEAPFEEAKLIRCLRGALYDVIVDLRPESKTFRQWVAVELRAEPARSSMLRAEEFATDSRRSRTTRSVLSDVRVLHPFDGAGIPVERPGVCH
jgi:dTDP-4-dehydrorhamnose 3,5-epimerase